MNSAQAIFRVFFFI